METAKILTFDGVERGGLTPANVLALKAFFPIEQHKFDRGMIYIREEAVANRLDEIDAGWSFEVVAVDWRDPMHCVVTAALTIKGVRRENAGENYGQKKNAENVQKSATTDALKRCARLFGVGRYLLSAGKIKDFRALKGWIGGQDYNPSTQLVGELTTESAQQHGAQPEPPAASDNGDWAWPGAFKAPFGEVKARVMDLDDVKAHPHANNILKKLGKAGLFSAQMSVDDILDVVRNREELLADDEPKATPKAAKS